jgi:hypothetical protein
MIPWKVTGLTVSGFYCLNVTFADGTTGTIDMSGERFEGVFAPLADPEFFAKACVEDGVVVWPNGADIAPDAMYDEIVAQRAA